MERTLEVDLSWLLQAPRRRFVEELLAAYAGPVDDAFRARSRFYYRLSPWYDVYYGLSHRRDRDVRDGLREIARRLGR